MMPGTECDVSACLKQWKLSTRFFGELRLLVACRAGVTCREARVIGPRVRGVRGGRSRPAVRPPGRGSLDGPVITEFENGLPSRLRVGGCVIEDALRCGLQVPTGCGGQADRARLLGHVFAGGRPCGRVRAWSGAAQPAVLNHIWTTARVMPIHEPVCWLRPSVTRSQPSRGSGSRRRGGRSRRG